MWNQVKHCKDFKVVQVSQESFYLQFQKEKLMWEKNREKAAMMINFLRLHWVSMLVLVRWIGLWAVFKVGDLKLTWDQNLSWVDQCQSILQSDQR